MHNEVWGYTEILPTFSSVVPRNPAWVKTSTDYQKKKITGSNIKNIITVIVIHQFIKQMSHRPSKNENTKKFAMYFRNVNHSVAHVSFVNRVNTTTSGIQKKEKFFFSGWQFLRASLHEPGLASDPG